MQQELSKALCCVCHKPSVYGGDYQSSSERKSFKDTMISKGGPPTIFSSAPIAVVLLFGNLRLQLGWSGPGGLGGQGSMVLRARLGCRRSPCP